MYLITPTLLNAFDYYFNFVGEASGDDEEYVSAEEKEAKVRQEFLQTLRREKTERTEAMQKGIDFEERVITCCNSHDDESPIVREIADIVSGGHWQAVRKRELDGYLLYARADVIKRDTIYDIKRTSSYDLGKYQKSMQHRIEFFCTGIPNFSYLISDERSWWREDYSNHAGIENEIREAIRNFTGYLENDPAAKELYYGKWKALEAQAA